MSNRPVVHIHSDCDFFGGCESMLVNLFQDRRLQRNFTLSFSYRQVPAYVEGLRKRLPPMQGEQGLALLAEASAGRLADRLPKVLALPLRALLSLLLWRYWVLAINVWQLVRAWKGRRIDLLHINNGGYPGASSARAAAIAARILGIPHSVMVVNNIAAAPRWHERPVERVIGRLMCCSVQAFVTGSQFANHALQRRLAGCGARFLGLHNGIGARQPDEPAGATRERLGIPADALVFLIVALHEPRKGHRVLLDALARMNAHLPRESRPVVVIEGTGPDEPVLRGIAVQLGLQDQVRFTGRERNVFNLMQCADVLVVPSIANEDFPNVVLEAMSLGTPVLASSLAGIPEQVVDGACGWLVPPGDASALAAAMLRLVQYPALMAAAGTASRNRFQSNFTSDIAVGRYINLYRELLNCEENK